MNIMLVDDDEICIFITKIVLQKHEHDFNIVTYQSAQKALEHLRSHPEIQLDLIFLDLNMPAISGFEFLDQLTTLYAKKNPPNVCLLSSSDNNIDISNAKNFSNVISYIEKPISTEKLSALLLKINTETKLLTKENTNIQ